MRRIPILINELEDLQDRVDALRKKVYSKNVDTVVAAATKATDLISGVASKAILSFAKTICLRKINPEKYIKAEAKVAYYFDKFGERIKARMEKTNIMLVAVEKRLKKREQAARKTK